VPDKTSRGVSNLPVVIPDVPDAPTVSASNVGTSRAFNNGAATVTIASPTGGLPASYSITTTPATTTTTTSTSPVTLTGLASATSYTVTATPTNVSATGPGGTSSSITATTVPQAPTIGTAADGGTGTTVSVPFTAGATGGAAVSTFTATSSPGSLTGTSATSPITVSGLTTGTAYTFTVTATNANGTSTASAASNSVTPANPPSFESIATLTGDGTASTLTFSSIPSTYVALQIRFMSRRNVGGNASNNNLYMRINGSSDVIYATHRLVGNGTVVNPGSEAPDTAAIYLPNGTAGSGQTAGVMSVGIVDFHDYKSTTRNKTIRYFGGNESNGVNTGYVAIASGLYTLTTAITSISFVDTSGYAFTSSSTFALYGIRG